MTEPNRVVIALTSIFAGAGAGGAVAACFVWAAWQQWAFLSVLGDLANTVFLGWGVGFAVAGYLCWRLSPAITETWRRAAMAFTAGMGAIGAGGGAHLVGMESQMTMSWFGSVMLPAYICLFVAMAIVALRFSRKHRAPGA
jgi:hypothetical protein